VKVKSPVDETPGMYHRYLLRLLVLGRDTLERDNEVLERSLLLVLLGRLSVHEIIKAGTALHEEVKTTHDGKDTEGEDPDTDNSNDAGLSVAQPSEDTEQGCNDIDDQHGTGELPRGDGRPERTIGTSDEDQPVLGQCDLEEENLDLTSGEDNLEMMDVDFLTDILQNNLPHTQVEILPQ